MICFEPEAAQRGAVLDVLLSSEFVSDATSTETELTRIADRVRSAVLEQDVTVVDLADLLAAEALGFAGDLHDVASILIICLRGGRR